MVERLTAPLFVYTGGRTENAWLSNFSFPGELSRSSNKCRKNTLWGPAFRKSAQLSDQSTLSDSCPKDWSPSYLHAKGGRSITTPADFTPAVEADATPPLEAPPGEEKRATSCVYQRRCPRMSCTARVSGCGRATRRFGARHQGLVRHIDGPFSVLCNTPWLITDTCSSHAVYARKRWVDLDVWAPRPSAYKPAKLSRTVLTSTRPPPLSLPPLSFPPNPPHYAQYVRHPTRRYEGDQARPRQRPRPLRQVRVQPERRRSSYLITRVI